MLEEELSKMKSSLVLIESNILKYEQKNDTERANQYLTMWNTLVSRINKAEGKLTELQESMSKKARMIQEGMLMPIPVVILLFSIHICLQVFLLYLAFYVFSVH